MLRWAESGSFDRCTFPFSQSRRETRYQAAEVHDGRKCKYCSCMYSSILVPNSPCTTSFWPIAWLVGCAVDLILGCTRHRLQMYRVYPFLVIVDLILGCTRFCLQTYGVHPFFGYCGLDSRLDPFLAPNYRVYPFMAVAYQAVLVFYSKSTRYSLYIPVFDLLMT